MHMNQNYTDFLTYSHNRLVMKSKRLDENEESICKLFESFYSNVDILEWLFQGKRFVGLFGEDTVEAFLGNLPDGFFKRELDS